MLLSVDFPVRVRGHRLGSRHAGGPRSIRQPASAGQLLGTAARAAHPGCAALPARSSSPQRGCWATTSLTWLMSGVAVLASLPSYLGLSYGWVFRAYERMDCEVLLNVILKLASLVFAITCVALGGRVVGLIFSHCGCRLADIGRRAGHLSKNEPAEALNEQGHRIGAPAGWSAHLRDVAGHRRGADLQRQHPGQDVIPGNCSPGMVLQAPSRAR